MTAIDNPALRGMECYYGVPLGPLGEDGEDGFAAVTTDRRRALAAVSAHTREWWGHSARGVKVAPLAWWVLVTNCGCGDTCGHPVDEDGWKEHDCDQSDLPPCGGTYEWVGEVGASDRPGAVPVFKIELS